jgi:hypothetical protein
MHDVERERVGNGSVPFRVNFALVAFPFFRFPFRESNWGFEGLFSFARRDFEGARNPLRFP